MKMAEIVVFTLDGVSSIECFHFTEKKMTDN